MLNRGGKRRLAIHLSSLTSGGAERVAVGIADHFVSRGWDVAIITLFGKELDFYAFSPSIERMTIQRPGEGRGRAGAFFRYLIRLRRALRAYDPDVLITLMTRENVIGLLAAVGTGVPVVASERNYPPARPLSRPWEILRRFVYGMARVHVAQTAPIRDWLLGRTAAERVEIIPNALKWPLAETPPHVAPDSVVDPSARVILAVGRKAWQKGFDLLVEAFAAAVSETPGWTLVIVGLRATLPEDHRAERVMRERSASPDLADRVVIIERAGNIGDWYERADIFALSSRFEGFPNVLLEAMASGTACISFDCMTGPADLIRDGENGILVPDGDTAAFASGLKRLVADPNERERLGEAARGVRETFSPEIVLAKWQAVVEELAPADRQRR